MIVEGSPATLRAPLQGRMIELSGAPPKRLAAIVAPIGGIEEIQIFGATLRLRVSPGEGDFVRQVAERTAREAGEATTRARVIDASLEDVLRSLLQHGSEAAGEEP